MLEEVAGDRTLEELHAASGAESAEALGVVWMSPVGIVRVAPLSGRDELVVGRHDGCDIVLEGELTSRRHARFLRNAGFWFIQDLDSRNGVRLNGAAVKRGPLMAGSVLRLGSWIGVVRPFEPSSPPRFGDLGDGLFGGPELENALQGVDVASRVNMPVVLEGETGTGKELFARAIHERSCRGGPFLAVNCAALHPSNATAELFGYRRGAFTGAVEAHGGLVPAAHGGTLLLDEVADLSLEVQAQMLRAIEQGEVLRLGESRPTRVDVRFVAATQRPLAQWVSEGRFRADLQARLEGLRIVLPPLRQRMGDVPLLFLNLLREHSPSPPRLEARVLEWLTLRDWPLNVRELVALARRTLATYPGASDLSLEQLVALTCDPLVQRSAESAIPNRPSRRSRVDGRAFRPEMVETFRAALERNSGSVARAAAELKISRQRAYRILRLCPGSSTV